MMDLWNKAFPELTHVSEFMIIIPRLILAALLGGLIGLERERQRKSAGLRTHMLVALGSALFIVAAVNSNMDPDHLSRVIQGIATGIGFLGGGAIIKFSSKSSSKSHVRGMTSAATIWLTAGLGIAIALGQLLTSITIVILTWGILAALQRLESLSVVSPPSGGEKDDDG